MERFAGAAEIICTTPSGLTSALPEKGVSMTSHVNRDDTSDNFVTSKAGRRLHWE
jgi:hypothetical protein